MGWAERVSLVLAGVQTIDFVATRDESKYGPEHLDHLRVPLWLRPFLPAIKVGIIGILVVTARRPVLRRLTGAALVGYYAAAVGFHLHAGDSAADVAPAALCCGLAGSLAGMN